MKNIQISQELFIKLVGFHLLDRLEDEEYIKQSLEEKVNSMVKRELYTKSKTSPTEEEREKYRKEYLDKIGMYSDCRW